MKNNHGHLRQLGSLCWCTSFFNKHKTIIRGFHRFNNFALSRFSLFGSRFSRSKHRWGPFEKLTYHPSFPTIIYYYYYYYVGPLNVIFFIQIKDRPRLADRKVTGGVGSLRSDSGISVFDSKESLPVLPPTDLWELHVLIPADLSLSDVNVLYQAVLWELRALPPTYLRWLHTPTPEILWVLHALSPTDL